MSEETALLTVKYDELAEAFEFVSFAPPMEHQAFIDRTTGRIYWVSDAVEDESPEDLHESSQYIDIPHKNELDLGTNLALRFVTAELPAKHAQIKGFFRHRGAYARFKETLAAEGLLDKWYAFESESTASALRAWCAENGIQLIEDC